MGTVGDDHIRPAAGDHAGGTELGGHAAGAKGGTGAIGKCHHLRGDLLHQRDQPGIRMGVGVGGVQTVNVAEQHQQVCATV